MKNALKFSLTPLLIGVTVAACDPPAAKSTETPDDSPKVKIDTLAKAKIDTSKKDTAGKK